MKYAMRRITAICLMLVILIVAVSCAGFIKNAYVTLNTSKDFYIIAMSSVARMQSQGLIMVEQRLEINGIALAYKEAHNLAVDALATYKITSSAADKDRMIVALGEVAARWAQVARLINAIKPGTVPATLSQ